MCSVHPWPFILYNLAIWLTDRKSTLLYRAVCRAVGKTQPTAMNRIMSSRRQDTAHCQPHSAPTAAGRAPSPAASEYGRESERGRLNKSKEPQTGFGSIIH